MNKQLLILRHAKSDWGLNVRDFDRPLKKRGKQAAQRMGLWLQQQDLVPDYIISSPAERAKTTAEKLTEAMDISVNLVHHDSRLYAAELDDLIAVLSDCPQQAKRILLVAHNPGLEELIEFLHKDSLQIPEDGKLLPTATLAVLAMPDDWYSLPKNCAEVLSITRPADLP
ncbi:MAG: histidine phosphatase family protein [Methylococcaceae bacterium]|nr:histidine phosphatase family protein [Methylococcaceae bacterium]